MNNNQRTFFTEAETTGRADFHLDILFGDFRLQSILDFHTAITATAGAGANRD